MQICFFIFFSNIYILVLSGKTEIKFNLNVPSLFRCKRNGRLFYFDQFPTDELFHHAIINQTNDCDLSLMSSNKRIILDIAKLDLHCNFKIVKFEDRVNEVLFFKTNCSADGRCIRLTPSAVTIITNYIAKSGNPTLFDLKMNGVGTENLYIGSENENTYSWEKDVYNKGGVRQNQILFKILDKYLNMMCEYTYINNPKNERSICRHQYKVFKNSIESRNGKMTSEGNGWSWLCYYYPSGAENPMDHTMISKAIEELENLNSSKPRILPLLHLSNLSELSNISSISPNSKNNDSVTSILVLLFVLISAGAIFCVYKNKFQDNTTARLTDTRSSLASQNSLTSNESISNEDD